MQRRLNAFAGSFAQTQPSVVERAVAVLYFASEDGGHGEMTPGEIASALTKAGFPRTNTSSLRAQLRSDGRVIAGRGRDRFRLKVGARRALEADLREHIGCPAFTATHSLLPEELTVNTRGYIDCVARQANMCYDTGCYDACLVMLRRLVETLIIETYENAGRDDEIKGADGHFETLSGLISKLVSDSAWNLGRDATRASRAAKTWGDRSAHSRRFNAKKHDVEKVQEDVRVLVEELLHLSGLS